MAPVEIRFLGSGDAVASGGRFQACILVSVDERRVLLDCGTTSMTALKRAGVDPAGVDTIFVSHLHGDHFAGIPFVVLDGQLAHRTRPLTIVGPSDIETRVRATMVGCASRCVGRSATDSPGLTVQYVTGLDVGRS